MKFLKTLADILTMKPRLTVLVLSVIYLVSVGWKGAEFSVPVAMTIAFLTVVLITAKQAE